MKNSARTYLLLCSDGTYYCGYSTNVVKRLARHSSGRGAKYTRGRLPVELAWTSGPMTIPEAMRLEVKIKKMNKNQKRILCEQNTTFK